MNNNLRTYGSLFLLLLVIILGFVSCQEEKEPLNEILVTPTKTTPSSTPNIVTGSPAESEITIVDPGGPVLQGEVVSIKDKTYIIKDHASEEDEIYSIEATPSILVDETLIVGDRIEVRFSEDRIPIAIRKIRKESSLGMDANKSMPNATIRGQLNNIKKEQGIYVVKTSEGEEIELMTNSNTLIDESLQEGDTLEVQVSTDNHVQAIAIRKLR
ncbi:MAG: hypothetical protein NPIRA04_20110 [Nitrospirales bacterium]|nr:MAG: hypothetical protein NPIRA04_20110 [Nitrospirales bacterium]